MRRIVVLVLLAVGFTSAFAGCRCERFAGHDPPTVLVPRAADAGANGDAGEICGTARSAVSGAAHATPKGRTFHVWTPSSYDGTHPLPVVFAVHGLGSDGRGFQKWFKMEQHTEGKAIVVYPDSREGMWDIARDTDLEFFDEMIDGLAGAYCIDRARVYAIGFSYGGKMVHHLGCMRTDRFRAISVGDGSWGGPFDHCGRLPVLVTHRTRDPDELFAWGKSGAERWSKINGCSTETDPTDADHGCFAWRGCAEGASVTFCEDRYYDAKWPSSWNHTIREDYLNLTWRWFSTH